MLFMGRLSDSVSEGSLSVGVYGRRTESEPFEYQRNYEGDGRMQGDED